MTLPKFALVSHVLPPFWTGQSVVLSRLLAPLDPAQYCLIGQTEPVAAGDAAEYLPALPARCHRLPTPPQITRGVRFGMHRLRLWLNPALQLLETIPRALRIAAILRRERCRAVVACTGDLINLPSAYLASRIHGVPFYAYIFDYYSRQMIVPFARNFANFVERRVLRGAAGVVAPNETLAEALRERYDIRPTVIHNPCVLADYEGPALPPRSAGDGEVRIVYTGAIYAAQLDAILNLLAALARLQRPEIRLHLYTAIPPAALEKMGLAGPVVVHPHESASRIAAIQRAADILFLPLAFDSPYHPDIVRTSAPGKTGEYLAAGRPILVHAPADCFLARYFRAHECGLVVDRKDPAWMAKELERLAGDAALRRAYAERAGARARADFDVAIARARFAALLDGGAPAEERLR